MALGFYLLDASGEYWAELHQPSPGAVCTGRALSGPQAGAVVSYTREVVARFLRNGCDVTKVPPPHKLE
jgi:hypothetical protein